MTKITFPDNSSDIISRIAKENKVEEEGMELFNKMKRGERTNGEILAQLVKRAAHEGMNQKDLVSSIKQELGVAQKIAENIGKSLNKELLINAETIEEKPEQEPEQEIILEKKGPPRKDDYRESVE